MNDPFLREVQRFGLFLDGLRLHSDGPPALQIAETVVVIVGFVWSVIWILRDSEQRGKSGILAMIFLVAGGWPFSILWWLWLRPSIVKFKFHPRTTPPKLP